MTATMTALIPLAEQRIEDLHARYGERFRIDGVHRRTALGSRDRRPRWYRRDAKAPLHGVGLTIRDGL